MTAKQSLLFIKLLYDSPGQINIATELKYEGGPKSNQDSAVVGGAL